MDTTYQQTKSSFKERHADLFAFALSVGNFMYGSEKRTWITLAVAFGLLVGGIAMMQSVGNGGACAASSMG